MAEISYNEKLAALARATKNRAMLAQLARKPRPDKLDYLLRKFGVKVESGKPEAGSPKPEVKKAPPPPEPQLQKAKKIVRKLKEQKPGQWRIVKNGAEVDYDDMPAHLQNAWDENRDRYKQIRSLHEKLKLMHRAEPEDRQPLVNEIVRHDERIRKNWADIDAWQPGQEPDPAPEKLPVKMDHKRISANRKYISKNLEKCDSKNKKADYFRENIQQRYNEMKAAQVSMSEKTMAELKAAGIEI
jgi:hypothetical protein